MTVPRRAMAVVACAVGVALCSGPIADAQDAQSVAAVANASVCAILVQLNTGVASGTGFLAADGLVLTANHVVKDGLHISVKFPGQPAMDARVVAGDGANDLAVLSVAPLPIRPLALGNSDAVQAGQTVIAIGFPRLSALGAETPTVTDGIISAVRPGQLQMQVPVSPGNSGGPLLTLRGDVIGVVEATLGGQQQGINFATPINVARSLLGAAVLAPPSSGSSPAGPSPSAPTPSPSQPPAALPTGGAFSQPTVTVTRGQITYTFAGNKATYGPSEPVDLTFTITNTGSDGVRFEFLTKQYHDFVIRRGSEEVDRWSAGHTFAPSPTTLYLGPGRSMVFTTRWRQTDQDGRSVPPGTYQIIAVFAVKDHPVAVTLQFQKLE